MEFKLEFNGDRAPIEVSPSSFLLYVQSANFEHQTRTWVIQTGVKFTTRSEIHALVEEAGLLWDSGPYLFKHYVSDADELFIGLQCVDPEWDAMSESPVYTGDAVARLTFLQKVIKSEKKVEKKTRSRKAQSEKVGAASKG